MPRLISSLRRRLKRVFQEEPNALNHYVLTAPTAQNALDVFKGEWSSAFPERFGLSSGGAARLFDDPRLQWADEQLGRFAGQRVLELGPLEGGHSYMLEALGAASVTSIEANSRAFLKCLVTKELTGLKRSSFLCGDFVEYLRHDPPRFDVCVASGVLYHMRDPVELIRLIARVTDRIYLWTHYHDASAKTASPRAGSLPLQGVPSEDHGFKHTLYTHYYQSSVRWQGFCGGPRPSANWLGRDDILRCLKHHGFTDARIGFDDPNHVNGPSFSIAAIRGPAPAAQVASGTSTLTADNLMRA